MKNGLRSLCRAWQNSGVANNGSDQQRFASINGSLRFCGLKHIASKNNAPARWLMPQKKAAWRRAGA